VSGAKLSILIAVFFFTSVISVVTGSTSLITVPVMIALGIEAHVAVATNMLALTFMGVGGSLPFIGRGVLSRSRLPSSVALTIVGSGLGALLLLSVPLKALQIAIAVAMIGVAVVSLLNGNLGRAGHDTPASNVGVIIGYAATFLLAIYGGFFSGGYVTMLTAALSEHSEVSADMSLPLKREYFLFREQEDRCAAGGNRHGIRDGLFATVRCGAGLQSLHGGEMDLSNAMEWWCPLRGTDYFARHNFGLAGKLLDGHGHMFVLIYPLERFDVVWARINHH
jgi:hypothetical protein